MKPDWSKFEGATLEITVPQNITEKTFSRYSKEDLDSVSKIRDVAIDKLMVFVHYLYRIDYSGKTVEYKMRNLHSDKLKEIYGDNYKRIVELLEKKKVIYVDHTFKPSSKTNGVGHSKGYQLTGEYKQFKLYKVKSKWGRKQINGGITKKKEAAMNNIIAKNTVLMISKNNVVLPTIDQLKRKARKMAKEYAPLTSYYERKKKNAGEKVKKYKGKYCVLKREEGEEINTKKVRVLHENIERFKSLYKIIGNDTTTGKFKIPKLSNHNDYSRVICERVYDSTSMIPSWIRDEIVVNGERIIANDFKALHPHIMMKIYGAPSDYTKIQTEDIHKLIENATGIDRDLVKTQHLSFFNKKLRDVIPEDRVKEIYEHQQDNSKAIKWKATVKEKIVRFYYENHEQMLLNMLGGKLGMRLQHKATAEILFKAEVDLMTEIINELNSIDIYTFYVYDCLYSKESDKGIVRQIMNAVASRNGYKTRVS